MNKLIAINDKVIIKPIDEGETMYGTIIVPDMGKEKPEMGEVVSTGPGRLTDFGQFIPVNAEVGQIVLVPKIGTMRVDFDGDEYYIVQDREILAIIDKNEQ